MAKVLTLEDLEPYMDHEEDESPNIRPASDFKELVRERLRTKSTHFGAKLPWAKAEHSIQFRPGEVSLWLGINGHGKSLLLGQLITGFASQGERSCIASMEMKPEATLERMLIQASQGPEPSDSFIDRFHSWTDGKIWLYDQQGTVRPDRILALCRCFQAKCGGNHVVIDSLMKCGLNEDDYNGQKRFLDELTAIARDRKIHVHLVHHSRKLESEKNLPGKMDAKGTGAITDLVDNCITVWRNKAKEAKLATGSGDQTEFDALMIVDKQRHGEGWEGKIALWYDKGSRQYVGGYGYPAIDLMR